MPITIAGSGIVAANIADSGIVAANIADANITAAKLDGGQSGSAPIYGARALVNFDGTFASSPFTIANGGIRARGNVSSVTDNGTGDYTVNFTTAMEDVDYAVAVTGTNVGLDDSATAKTTSAFRFNTYNFSAVKTDGANVSVAIFR